MPVTIKRVALVTAMWLPFVAIMAMRAGGDDATEARLRDALRTTTEQLHRLESENAALQNRQSVASATPVVKERASAGSSRTIADLKRRLAAAEQDAAKAKMAHAEELAAAQKKDADNTKAIADMMVDKDKFATCKVKNEALLKIGFELLDRYQNAGFGDAFGRREPFTGIKRVELQNIAQDMRDKLRDNTVKP